MNRRIVLGTVFLLAIALAMSAAPALGTHVESRGPGKILPKMNFVAHLSGRTWVSRVNSSVTYTIETRAQGEAIFHVNPDFTNITFMVIAANIQNITMSHIHIDDGSKLGPIVVWLYPRSPPAKEIPGRFNGVLMMGTITAADLVGPLAGMTIKDLVTKMQTGFAYVVIHTSQHPPGEIRDFIH